MQIVLIILAIIGLIKLISILITIIISIGYHNEQNYEGIKRVTCFYKNYNYSCCYIIPTIYYSCSEGHFEIGFSWFHFIYYSSYSIDIEK